MQNTLLYMYQTHVTDYVKETKLRKIVKLCNRPMCIFLKELKRREEKSV